MQYLLGIDGYGILSLVLPLQWVSILIAAAGLPPAIAKYVAEYSAKDNKYMVKRVIITSAKIMLFMSLLISVSIFFLAKPLAAYLHCSTDVVILFQIVGLITPFSVVLGLLRGVFQGYQNMTYIFITKAAEQIFMIVLAVCLILIGLYVLGAVIGTIIGFAAAAGVALLLFRKTIWKGLINVESPIVPVDEYKLAKKLLVFSFPVILTGLAELAIYDTGTYFIKIFMNETYVGYYNIASPIARLPLIISSSVAVALLPAASEALVLNGNNLVEKYVKHSYRYMILVLLPLCVVITLYSQQIIAILFPRAPLAHLFAGDALNILVIGMAFFSIYIVSTSILQGLGKPYLPMFFLILGSIINLISTVILVPLYGLNGAAIATTIATFIIMILSVHKTLKITNTRLPWGKLAKIILTSILIALLLAPFPKTVPIVLITLFAVPFIYILILALMGCLEKRDLDMLNRFGYKLGPFSETFMKITKFLERFVE